MLVFGLGCGEGTSPKEHASPPAQQSAVNDPGDDSASKALSADSADADLRSRTKWVGDIPYDVFFDDPLSVVANSRTIREPVPGDPGNSVDAGNETGVPPSISTNESRGSAGLATGPTPEASLPDSVSVDWQQLADIETLNDEVKQLRNRLTAQLRTVASYNQSLEAIRNDATVLAAIAAVVGLHPETLSWQEKSPAVRDLAMQLAGQAAETGRQAFSEAQLTFEQIVVILNGGPAPDTRTSPDVSFSEIADRSELMKRVNRSFEFLRSEINTEGRFHESRHEVEREAALLAVLGGIVSTEAYGSTDEPQYQEYVRDFIAGNTQMVTAAGAENYQDFLTARDRVQNSCASCHGEYAFGDEGL